ncbi:hypothetical protein CLV59_11014 [Chitinophaga dinghuensis]|uniref:Uncharacterized protein n=1 Tax=Chitinophaga dinghuensis TaxID=1539050 RepID=A0A327VN62_9BACT|nr:hypothetical protein [Chitinophaga dinghuensis]RAJ74968.1 hypothetical protein CLV59_11014 [Chitinophaga dinghuensis]
MSFNDFWKRIFGEKKPEQQPETPINSNEPDFESEFESDYDYEPEPDTLNRIDPYTLKLEAIFKDWLIDKLRDNNALDFSFEGGGDEGFITFENPTDETEMYNSLDEYLFYILKIPTVGECYMNGSGTLYIADNIVKVKYSSTLNQSYDYNEETDEIIYGEKVTLGGGDLELFSTHV